MCWPVLEYLSAEETICAKMKALILQCNHSTSGQIFELATDCWWLHIETTDLANADTAVVVCNNISLMLSSEIRVGSGLRVRRSELSIFSGGTKDTLTTHVNTSV